MKNICLILVIATLGLTAKAQKFIQGGVGILLADAASEGGGLKGGKQIDFQYGKFSNNRVMNSITLSYYTNAQFMDPIKGYYIDINGEKANYTVNYKISVISLGYERKVTYGYTEFDDIWNRYAILYVGLNQTKVKEEATNVPKDRDYSSYLREGSKFGMNYGLGFGWARKFTIDMYAFGDIRGHLQTGIDSYGSARAFVMVNFGVRKLL